MFLFTFVLIAIEPDQSANPRSLVNTSIIHSLVLLGFSLTVKASTLIFIFGRASAISSAKEGKSGSIQNKYVDWAAQACVHFVQILTVYTLNSHLITLKVHNHKMYVFVSSTKIFEA